MTDKQLFMAIKRLDRLIMSSRRDLELATNELADLINAIGDLRGEVHEYRELLIDLGKEK